MVDAIRKFHSEVPIRILEVILTIYPLLPPLVITEIRKILNSCAGWTPDDCLERISNTLDSGT
jgi:hypothetical protein